MLGGSGRSKVEGGVKVVCPGVVVPQEGEILCMYMFVAFTEPSLRVKMLPLIKITTEIFKIF